jgi:hypothetical protein
VDQVLAEPRASPARPRARRWWGAAAVAVTAVSLLVTGRVARLGHRDPQRAAPPTAAAPAFISAAATVAAPAPPTPSSAPSTASAAHAALPPRHAQPPRKLATGTLLVQCTPWCVPFVDDEARGQDGRNHRLVVSAGAHRIGARRLDDRLERPVEVHAGESRTIAFTFE